MKRPFLLSLLLVPGCAAPAFLQPAYQQGRPPNPAGYVNAPAYGGPAMPQQVVQQQPQMQQQMQQQQMQPPQMQQQPVQGYGAQNERDLGQAYRPASRVDSNGQLTLGSPDVPLRGWNGDVVDGRRPGTTVGSEAGARALEPSPSGRSYIIELYQQVLDERDALRQEVDSLQQALGAAQGKLGSSSTSLQVWEQKVGALQEELRRLEAENADLASRLTTAQIRRLEAEKTLLETQIRWRREAGEKAQQPDQVRGN